MFGAGAPRGPCYTHNSGVPASSWHERYGHSWEKGRGPWPGVLVGRGADTLPGRGRKHGGKEPSAVKKEPSFTDVSPEELRQRADLEEAWTLRRAFSKDGRCQSTFVCWWGEALANSGGSGTQVRPSLLWEAVLGLSSPPPRRPFPAGDNGHLQQLWYEAQGRHGAHSLEGCL